MSIILELAIQDAGPQPETSTGCTWFFCTKLWTFSTNTGPFQQNVASGPFQQNVVDFLRNLWFFKPNSGPFEKFVAFQKQNSRLFGKIVDLLFERGFFWLPHLENPPGYRPGMFAKLQEKIMITLVAIVLLVGLHLAIQQLHRNDFRNNRKQLYYN